MPRWLVMLIGVLVVLVIAVLFVEHFSVAVK